MELPESTPELIKQHVIDKLQDIPDTPGIYLISNTQTKQVYVGSSKHIKTRLRKHIKDLLDNKHHSYKLASSFKTHGIACFKFEVLEHVTDPTLLITTEQAWIDKYTKLSKTKLMNVNKRADGADYLKRKRRKTKSSTKKKTTKRTMKPKL